MDLSTFKNMLTDFYIYEENFTILEIENIVFYTH